MSRFCGMTANKNITTLLRSIIISSTIIIHCISYTIIILVLQDQPNHNIIIVQHYLKQTNKQTNKQANKQTNKQANKQTSKQTNKQTNRQQTNKQTKKQLYYVADIMVAMA